MIAALLLIAAITGNVIAPDGAPVVKARVVAYRAETGIDRLRRESAKKERAVLASATTNDSGAFRLDAPDGIVELHVDAAGFHAEPVLVPFDEQGVAIAVEKGAERRADGDVRSPLIDVRGKVIDANDKAVAHATVVVDEIAIATTGDDGRFTLAHVPRGGLLHAMGDHGEGYATARAGEITVHLARHERVSGTVRDEAKKPVAGVVIYRALGEEQLSAEAVSDAKGAFTLLAGPAAADAGPYVEPVMNGNDITIKRLASVDGVVRDEHDEPVAGAFVSFVEQRGAVITDRSGRFRLHVAPGRKGTINARRPGFPEGSSEPFTVPAGGRHDVVVRLQPSVEVSGIVSDSGGHPLAGVAIRRPSEPEELAITTADDGRFIVHVEPGAAALLFAKTGYVNRSVDFEASSSMQPLRIAMKDAAIVRGILLNKDGTPAAGQPLGEQKTDAVVMTNADGTFQLDFPEAGTYTIETMMSSHKFAVHAPSSDVRLVLDPGLSVRGRIVDAATSEPVEEFHVLAENDASVEETGPGEFVVSGLQPGPVTLIVDTEQYVRKSIDAVAGQPDVLAIALERGVTLRGRVHDADGLPVDSVTVMTVQATRTEADGTFALGRFAPNEQVTLTFARNGWLTQSRQVRATKDAGPIDVTLSRGLSVQGHVVDASGKPVAGVPVIASSAAYGASDRMRDSDVNGAFVLDAMLPARYDFHAGGPRTSLHGSLRDVDVEQVHDVTIRVEARAVGTVAGRVLGSKPESLLRTVDIFPASGEPMNDQLKADGTFRVEQVPAGMATIVAIFSGVGTMHSTRKVPVEVVADSITNVELQLEEQRLLRGRVTRNGHPVAHAEVTLSGSDSVLTADDGTYEVHADPGRYRVTVDGLPWSGEVDVEHTSVFDIDVQSFVAHVLVLDGDSGAAISGAEIKSPYGTRKTDPNGRADIEVLRGNPVTLIASKSGYANASAGAVDGDVAIRLARAASGAVVRIVDARDGRTLAGYAVARDAVGHVIASGLTEGDGMSHLPVVPGEYRFSASATGYGSETVRASVPSNEVRIALPRGGQLLLRSNEDLHGNARLLLPDGDVYVRCWCNGSGDIELDGRLTTVDVISPGSYTLEVTPIGGKPRRYPVTVVEGETVPVQID